MLRRLVVLSTLLICASAVRAGIVVSFNPALSNATDWFYDVRLEPGAVLPHNGYFELYDIPDLTVVTVRVTSGASKLEDWHVDEPLFGQATGFPPPGFTNPHDNPNLVNVQVSLSGNEIKPGNAILDLLQLRISTLNHSQGTISYTDLSQQTSGSPIFDLGMVTGPALLTTTVVAAPEPAIPAMLITGLVTLIVLAFYRSRQRR